MAQSHYAQRRHTATDNRPARRTSPTRNTPSTSAVVIRGSWTRQAQVAEGRAQAAALVYPLRVTYGIRKDASHSVAGLVIATRRVTPRTLEMIRTVQRQGAPVLVAAAGQLWPIEAWRPTHTRDGVRLIPVRAGDANWRAQQHTAARTALGLDTAAEVA